MQTKSVTRVSRLVWACALVVSTAVSAHAGYVYVDDSSPNNPGTGTAADPYRSIEAAIAGSSDGDEIRVGAGIYYPTVPISFSNKTLRGGYPGYGQAGTWETQNAAEHVADIRPSSMHPYYYAYDFDRQQDAVLAGLSLEGGRVAYSSNITFSSVVLGGTNSFRGSSHWVIDEARFVGDDAILGIMGNSSSSIRRSYLKNVWLDVRAEQAPLGSWIADSTDFVANIFEPTEWVTWGVSIYSSGKFEYNQFVGVSYYEFYGGPLELFRNVFINVDSFRFYGARWGTLAYEPIHIFENSFFNDSQDRTPIAVGSEVELWDNLIQGTDGHGTAIQLGDRTDTTIIRSNNITGWGEVFTGWGSASIIGNLFWDNRNVSF